MAKKNPDNTPPAKQVSKLRSIIDKQGLAEGGEFASSIFDESNTDMILPLLQLGEYGKDTDNLDEMWLVIHTVEGYPKEAFLPVLASNLNSLADKSPELVSTLLIRIFNSDDYRKYLLDHVRKHPPAAVNQPAKVLLEKLKKESDAGPKKKAAEELLKAFTK